MSLVINSNNQIGSGTIVANEFLNTYPDFKNNVLIIPGGDIVLSRDTTPATGGAVLEVNGTKINSRNYQLLSPDYWKGIPEGTDNTLVGFGATWTIGGTGDTTIHTTSMRVGIDAELQNGNIIGKSITAGFLAVYRSWSGGSCRNFDFKIEVKLLHSDGTLTTVGTVDFPYADVDNDGAGGTYFEGTGFSSGEFGKTQTRRVQKMYRTKTTLTSGTTAQDGDRLVADYSISFSNNNLNGTYTLGVILGYANTINVDKRCLPLSISVD